MTSEHKIGNKGDVQAHWHHNGPINDKLKNIVEPLSRSFTEEMQRELEVSTSETRQAMLENAGNVYQLSYGRIGKLPPAIFGDISEETIELTTDLVVPDSDEKIEALIDKYMDWAWRRAGLSKSGNYAFPTRQNLINEMRNHKGVSYPYEKWLAAATAVQQSLKDEDRFMIDVHFHNRIFNAANDHDQLDEETANVHRQHESYVLVMSRHSAEDRITQGTRDYIQMPIGEYGIEAAGKLARMTVALSDFIKESPMLDVRVRAQLTDDDKELLTEHTARSREKHKQGVADHAVHGIKNTLTEGILSQAQVIAFLTAEKVDGYDDFDELVSAILDSDVIEQFTRITRPGYIGPVSLAGLYMPGALVEKNGKLALSKEAVKVLSTMRKEYVADTMAKWALYKEEKGEHPQILGITCPAAAPKGAITEIKGILKAFYDTSMPASESLLNV